MSSENRSSDVIFDHKTSWNFVEEAVKDGFIDEPKAGTYAKLKIEEGRSDGWIKQSERLNALHRFILGEKVFLPMNLHMADENPPLLDQLINEGVVSSQFESIDSKKFLDYFDLGGYRFLEPFILNNLRSRGIYPSKSDFDIVKTDADTRMLWLPQKVLGEIKLNPTLSAILEEHWFLTESICLSEYGVATIGNVSHTTEFPKFKEPPENQIDKSSNEVIGIYFRNYFRVPQPLNIGEAIKMKNSPNIKEWREKIHNFSIELMNGDIDEQNIKKAVERANEYFKGAKSINTVLTPIVQLIFTGAEKVTEKIPQLQHLHSLAMGANWLVTYFTVHGWLAERAALNSSDKEFRWVHIDTSK